MSARRLATVRVFDRLPSLLSSYPRMIWRAITSTKPNWHVEPLVPALIVRADNTHIDPAHLQRYLTLCGLSPSSTLPMTYPQVLAMGLQARLLTTAGFPYSPLGVVHTHSDIEEIEPIEITDTLDFVCTFGRGQRRARGFELELVTTVAANGSIKGHSTTTVLWRTSHASSTPTAAPLSPPQDYSRRVTWALARDLGRRYARVSGDYNPIHLTRTTARMFGYDRPIAHGLWILAHALAHLEADTPPPPRTLSVHFMRPLLLPTTAVLMSRRSAEGVDLALVTSDVTKSYCEGSIRATLASQV